MNQICKGLSVYGSAPITVQMTWSVLLRPCNNGDLDIPATEGVAWETASDLTVAHHAEWEAVARSACSPSLKIEPNAGS